MKVDKINIQDVFPSQDGSLKLILIDREGDKHILRYPKSYEHVYLNDMCFFINQGYIVLDNGCVPVNPIILTDDMIGKQVQLLNGDVHKVYKHPQNNHYIIGRYIYDCFGHGRIMSITRDTVPLSQHVLGPIELKYDPSLNSAFNTTRNKYIISSINFDNYSNALRNT